MLPAALRRRKPAQYRTAIDGELLSRTGLDELTLRRLRRQLHLRYGALSYRERTTDLRVLAPSVDALDRIRSFATERGMSAVIQSANPRDQKYEGRMQFKPST